MRSMVEGSRACAAPPPGPPPPPPPRRAPPPPRGGAKGVAPHPPPPPFFLRAPPPPPVGPPPPPLSRPTKPRPPPHLHFSLGSRPRQIVGPLPLQFDRRIDRRHLLDLPGEALQHCLHLRQARPSVGSIDHRPFRIQRVRLLAEADGEFVQLV